MYELLKNIDFTKKRSSEKTELKRMFYKYLKDKDIYYDESSYFTDAVFIGNNPQLKLDIVDVLENDKFEEYKIILVEYFTKKFEDVNDRFSQNPLRHSELYVERLQLLQQFFYDYKK